MIAVISSGAFLKGALQYNFNKVEQGNAAVISANNIMTPDDIAGTNMEMVMQSFLPNIENNNRTKNITFSCNLDPAFDDAVRLSDADFADIAKDYMEKMGYGNQPYVVFKHQDIERTHIHIVSIRVDADGKRLDTHFEQVKSNRIRKELDQKYKLIEEPNRSNRKGNAIDPNRANDYIEKKGAKIQGFAESFPLHEGDRDVVNTMRGILNYVEERYSPKDIKELNKILRLWNIQAKTISVSDKKGSQKEGAVYSIIDRAGHPVGHLLKGSLFGPKHSISGLNKRFETAQKLDRTVAVKNIAKAVNKVLSDFKTVSLPTFQDELKKSGIAVQINKAKDGRMAGISFIDNTSGTVAKGSELGKQFSISSLLSRLSDHDERKKLFNKDTLSAISANYNDLRKSKYFYESDLIKALPDELSSLCKGISMTPENKATLDDFINKKTASLSFVEEKENSYGHSQLDIFTSFAKSLDSDLQTPFLYSVGLTVKNGEVSLINRTSISADDMPFCDTCPDDRTTLPLPKELKNNIKLFVNSEGKHGNFLELEKQIRTSVFHVSPDTFKSAVKLLSSQYNQDRKTCFYESNFIGKLDSLKQNYSSLIAEKLDLRPQSALAITECFFAGKTKLLPAVCHKEADFAKNKISDAVHFAVLVAPDKRQTLFSAMGISVTFDEHKQPVFTMANNKNFSFKWNEVAADRPSDRLKIPAVNTIVVPELFRQSDSNVLFNKHDKAVVKAFVSEQWSGVDLSDNHKSHVLPLLDADAKCSLQKHINGDVSARIINDMQNAPVKEVVSELLLNGFIITPALRADNTRTYVIGRPGDDFKNNVQLPVTLVETLKNSNYDSIYPTVRSFTLSDKGFITPKYKTMMQLATAKRSDNPATVQSVLNNMARFNRPLAEHLADSFNKHHDYNELINKVSSYDGNISHLVSDNNSHNSQETAFASSLFDKDAKIDNSEIKKHINKHKL
jgi:hypothetical protein